MSGVGLLYYSVCCVVFRVPVPGAGQPLVVQWTIVQGVWSLYDGLEDEGLQDAVSLLKDWLVTYWHDWFSIQNWKFTELLDCWLTHRIIVLLSSRLNVLRILLSIGFLGWSSAFERGESPVKCWVLANVSANVPFSIFRVYEVGWLRKGLYRTGNGCEMSLLVLISST